MTPEAERELLEYLAGERRRRTERPPATVGELQQLRAAVQSVADNQLRLMSDQRRAEARIVKRLDRHHERIAQLETPGREPMPSVSADDSGSIDLAAFGSSLKLRGALPVRAAIAIALALLFVAGGWLAHTAIASATPPPTAGQVPTPHGGTP